MTYEEVLKILQASEQECYKNGYDVEQALKIAKQAVERQIPKKPITYLTGQICGNWIKLCPTCNAKLVERITTKDYSEPHIYNISLFCIKCGQHLDWSVDNAES